MAEGAKRPITTAGRQLRSLLVVDPGERWQDAAKDAARFFARLPASLGLGAVAREAFDTLVRRKFAQADPRGIAEYAAEAIIRVHGRQGDRRFIRAAEAAIRHTMGERWATRGVGQLVLARAQIMLMRDMIRTESMTVDAVDALIGFAEDRCFQFSRVKSSKYPYRKRTGWRLGRLLWRESSFSRRDRAAEDPPRTLIGRSMYARMTGDRATASRMPHDPREEDAQAVYHALFELAIQRRFAAGCCLRDIAAFVEQTAQRTPYKLRSSHLEAEAIIRRQLGEPLPIDDIDPTTALEAKVASARHAIVSLGLFDHELNQLLKDAEQLAIERGFQPTPASHHAAG